MREDRADTSADGGPGDAESPDRLLSTIERRVVRARSASEDIPAEEATRLAAIERDLLLVTGELTRREPDLADDRGHPVLADVSRWRRRCRTLGLDAEVEQAGLLLDGLVDDEAQTWRAAAEIVARTGSAQDCFEALSEASVLDREAVARRGRRASEPPLEDDRGPLRQAVMEKIEADPPDDATRDRWTTDLLDRADVVLTGIDDLPPAAASAQLAVAERDVAFHLAKVEPRRGSRRRRLRRKRRRLLAEIQERGLQGRLEGIFGARAVGRFERLILFLIFLVLGLLAAEAFVSFPREALFWFTIVDTLACLVFLWDFFFRLALVDGKGRWFARHWLVDLLPSIPFGVLSIGVHGPDWVRAGRVFRFLRVTRVARYVRVLMPIIRMVRAIGFLTRGVDRVVRRYGHLLNRDVILYPTREELQRAKAAEGETSARLRRLQAEIADLWEDLLLSAEEPERDDVARIRLAGIERAREDGATRRPPVRGERASATREVPAEVLLKRLEGVTADGVEADLGPDFVSRAARAVRLFSRPPLRWIPVIGGFFPRLGPRMTDSEVVAAGAHQAARRMRKHHARWFWFADLYGTVTPAEFVDRVGSTLMRGAFRPAYRLMLFGLVFLLVELLLFMMPWGWLDTVAGWLSGILGPVLVVLGGVCLAILAVGWYLKHIAGKATLFYEQTALAQFLALTESIKGRFLERDAEILCRRVIGPEAMLRGELPEARCHERRQRFVEGVRGWLLSAHAGGDAKGAFDAMERTVLLHRDGMDGGILHDSDTRTTNQLLGNPVLRHLRRSAWCVDAKERKELRGLDLEQQRRLVGGPYFWFSLVNRAVAQSAARLIVAYNRNAIPLAELERVTDEDRQVYQAWLTEDECPPAVHAAVDDARYVTAAFTALHFLDDDPRRDHEVAERFGPPVLRRLRRDRRRLIRRVFGTYPLHARPHEQRVVNLYRLYQNWLAGGRALLLPVRGIWGGVRWIGHVVGWVVQSLREIKNPKSDREYQEEAEADYATAVRKIDRMRAPAVRASIWLRARCDVEYLGVRLPGTRRTGIEGVGAITDLDFLDAPVELRRGVEEEHDLAQADMRRLSRLIRDGVPDRVADTLGVDSATFGREHMRAAAFVYRADVYGVRSLLSADDVLEETAVLAARQKVHPPVFLPRPRLWFSFRRWWKERGEAIGNGDRFARKAAWRAVRHDVNGAGRALRVHARWGAKDAAAEGERRLTDLLRHPGRLSGQLVTLRAVQTLALIDELNYRQHVWRLGAYEADGDEAGDLLTLPGTDSTDQR